tara:strand:+ start:679 stop:1446 length:768 start_codon:yes stop_codon:yes gene_type:complete
MFGPVKSTVLSWFGISGGALTLLSNLSGVLELADWVRWLTNLWSECLARAWDWVQSATNLNLNPAAKYQITMALFVICIAAGSRLGVGSERPKEGAWSTAIQKLLRVHVGIAICLFAMSALGVLFAADILAPWPTDRWLWPAYNYLLVGLYMLAIFVGLAEWPRSCAATVAVSMVLISIVFQSFLEGIEGSSAAEDTVSFLLGNGAAIVCGLIVLMVAPARRFTYRLLYVMVGLAILIGLNELSKLGFKLSPPKV